MRLTALVLLLSFSFDAVAVSLRAGRFIRNFLDYRVDEVAKTLRLDMLLQVEYETLAQHDSRLSSRQLIKRITDMLSDPHYVPEASEVLKNYIQDISLTKPMFWRLHDPSGGVHHLFGTMHTFDISNFDEVAIGKLGQIIDSSTLSLGESTSHALLAAAKRGEVEINADTSIRLDSLDDQISFWSLSAGKQVRELETQEDIIAAVRSSGFRAEYFSDKAELERLLTNKISSRGLSREEALIDAVVEQQLNSSYTVFEYATGDTESLIHRLTRDIDELDEVLLGQRNRLWTERITTACQQEDSCFIYVGLAHMLAESGNIRSLVSLLKEQGFEIEELF